MSEASFNELKLDTVMFLKKFLSEHKSSERDNSAFTDKLQKYNNKMLKFHSLHFI